MAGLCCMQMQWHWSPRPSYRASIVCSSASSAGKGRNLNMAVLLEIEGVVSDVQKNGHRQSFNAAFQKLGLDCANWSEPVYLDLSRQTGGEERKMLSMFFDRIGWPSSLPTDEKDTFVRKLMQSKQTELEELMASGRLPLQPGLDAFIDEARREEVPLILISAYSRSGERLARLFVEGLDAERKKSVQLVGVKEVESSAYGQVELGKGVSSSADELLAMEVAKSVASQKQRLAKEVASALKLSVDVETTSPEDLKRAMAALRAAAEIAELPANRCILLAGGLLGTRAANQIGMPCIVVRSSSTARAEFPLAKASLDGFGVGAVTIQRLVKYANA